jgi:hypothetical protein
MTAGTMRIGQRVLSQGKGGLRAGAAPPFSAPLPLRHPLEVRHG